MACITGLSALLLSCSFSVVLLLPTSFRDEFTAAVYENAGVSVYATERGQAVDAMTKNLLILDAQARIAKQKGADIIVFPEYGITGDAAEIETVPNPRQVLYPYMEPIPDATKPPTCSLCSSLQLGTEAIQKLACIAKNNRIYVVGNMIEMKACNRATDSRCPNDDHYQYNTNAIFNRNGCLIAKYRKVNLYAEEAQTLNRPDQSPFVYFDTEFGRFGTMICFDALYKEPGTSLVEKYNIDHMLFPTYWDNNNDYHWARSNQWFIGWAKRMGVNFIASNYNNLGFETQGSVIASPYALINYTFDATAEYGKLLTGKLKINPRCREQRVLPSETKHALENTSQGYNAYGNITVYQEVYNATVLQGRSGLASVCYDQLCCTLDFQRSSVNETFVLSAFVGMQVFEGPYHVEVCLLYRCANNSLESCSERVSTSATSFSFFSLKASFEARHVFPNILPSGYRYEKIDLDFRRNGAINEVTGGSAWPLVSAALVGRDYTKDPVTQTVRP